MAARRARSSPSVSPGDAAPLSAMRDRCRSGATYVVFAIRSQMP